MIIGVLFFDDIGIGVAFGLAIGIATAPLTGQHRASGSDQAFRHRADLVVIGRLGDRSRGVCGLYLREEAVSTCSSRA